ncbi:MAG: hypothetical protein JWL81_3505 [Verrucomicrobiales bacterium]|nr:hypothetical protein [Verrucomicrobiales bacterium]
MSHPQFDHEAILRDLNELVVNCPDLTRIESLLGSFNIFQVLRSEWGELKHSNVLAWLLDPAESHGFDGLFLQKWLMRVTHGETAYERRPVTPVEIDAWDLRSVEVRREFMSIDVLIILTMGNGAVWVVCIENKVNSFQRSGQLSRYRQIVEEEFPGAVHKLFVLLSKNNETPHDEAYISASYHQVHAALCEAVTQRRMSIGNEPRLLIDNYMRLLEEKFMNQSEIANLARTIYKKHQRAIDVIFAHRPQNSLGTTRPIVIHLLSSQAESLGIVMGPCSKNFIRFIPREWDQPGNSHGGASLWAHSKLQILFEVDFSSACPRLLIVGGNPPPEWAAATQSKCDGEGFRHLPNQRRNGHWPRFYSEALEALSLDEILNQELAAQAIFEALQDRLASEDMKKVIATIADELPALDAHYQAKAQPQGS